MLTFSIGNHRRLYHLCLQLRAALFAKEEGYAILVDSDVNWTYVNIAQVSIWQNRPVSTEHVKETIEAPRPCYRGLTIGWN
jgi:hypothetical protein